MEAVRKAPGPRAGREANGGQATQSAAKSGSRKGKGKGKGRATTRSPRKPTHLNPEPDAEPQPQPTPQPEPVEAQVAAEPVPEPEPRNATPEQPEADELSERQRSPLDEGTSTPFAERQPPEPEDKLAVLIEATGSKDLISFVPVLLKNGFTYDALSRMVETAVGDKGEKRLKKLVQKLTTTYEQEFESKLSEADIFWLETTVEELRDEKMKQD